MKAILIEDKVYIGTLSSDEVREIRETMNMGIEAHVVLFNESNILPTEVTGDEYEYNSIDRQLDAYEEMNASLI